MAFTLWAEFSGWELKGNHKPQNSPPTLAYRNEIRELRRKTLWEENFHTSNPKARYWLRSSVNSNYLLLVNFQIYLNIALLFPLPFKLPLLKRFPLHNYILISCIPMQSTYPTHRNVPYFNTLRISADTECRGEVLRVPDSCSESSVLKPWRTDR
jgi:hypothetical protein